MQVLLTVFLIAIAAAWALTVYRRLDIMRGEIKLAWKRLETDQSNAAVKQVYNRHVDSYNKALDAFPASIIAPLVGLKPARPFNP
jgi:hypothetical protein